MSVQSEIDRIITAVGNAYSKVSEKGGTVPASQTVANLATAIASIPAGGGAPSLQSKSVTYTANGTATITPDDGYDGLSSVDVTVNVSGGGGSGASAKWDDVTFIDYDGSVLYSYSLSEAQALTGLPALPSHDGLVCQGWNWTLEAIKALNRPVTVGAMYITDDGKTRIYIHLEEGRTSPVLGVCPKGTVDVDWGDGTTHNTLTGSSTSKAVYTSAHHYAAPGDYVIQLTVTGSMGFRSNGPLMYASKSDNRNDVYRNAIRKVELGSGVTSIGDSAFNDCYSLSSITIPDGVTSIGENTFAGCFSLSSITIPDGVTSIGNGVFNDCYSLSSITIPDGVTSIGVYTFAGCYSLSSIAIPDGVTSISINAFQNCPSLSSITIPDGVTSIGENAFAGCSGLSSIAIPDGVTSIGDSAFNYCSSLSSITIPDGVTSIGVYTFSGCSSLSSITIPDGVTSIGDSVFNNCYSLSSITIPDGVTSIGVYTFSGCSGLSSIAIPDGVTSIGNGAFTDCYGMRYYDFSACTAIPALSNKNAFSNIPSDCQMLIPSSLYNNWKAATNWATYASKMVSV